MANYIAQTDVEKYLGVSLTSNGQNTFALLLPLLQDMIDVYCNRSWNITNPITETFDAIRDGAQPTPNVTFFVKYPPINQINSITINGIAWDLTYAHNYKTFIKLDVAPLTIFLSTTYGLQKVVIEYQSDAAGAVPGAVKAAFIQWMARMIQTAPDAGRDVTRTQAGTVQVRYAEDKTTEMPDFVRMVLDAYRLPPVDRF